MSFFDELFGKDGNHVSKEMADKLLAAGNDLDSMAAVVLDELAENKGKKDRVYERLLEAGDIYRAKQAEYDARVAQGAFTKLGEAKALDDLDDAQRREQEEAELVDIYRNNERVYRDQLHAIERIRAQGSRRMSAEALDEIRDRVQKAYEDHRIKELAGKDLRSLSEDIRKHAERTREETIEERRARHVSSSKYNESAARGHRELE